MDLVFSGLQCLVQYASVTCPSDYWKRLAIAATNGLIALENQKLKSMMIVQFVLIVDFIILLGGLDTLHIPTVLEYGGLIIPRTCGIISTIITITHTHVLLDPAMSYRVKQESNVHAQAVQLMAEPLTW